MFSTGQIVFAGIFILVFAISIALTYKKDKNLHNTYYGNVRWIAISIVIFIVILFLIKHLLKN